MHLMQIHYYFNDESHSMDTAHYLACKKAAHTILSTIAKDFEIEASIETIAPQEGGLLDTLKISPENQNRLNTYILAVMSGLTVYLLTTPPDKYARYNNEREFIKNLEADGFTKLSEIEAVYP